MCAAKSVEGKEYIVESFFFSPLSCKHMSEHACTGLEILSLPPKKVSLPCNAQFPQSVRPLHLYDGPTMGEQLFGLE